MQCMTERINNTIMFKNRLTCISEGKKVKIKVRGRIMLPCIDDRFDEVLLEPVNEKKINCGAIVRAYIEKRYILHRVVDIKNDIVTLMGDGNIKEKEVCNFCDIKAIVKIRIRNNKEYDLSSYYFCIFSGIWIKLKPIRGILLIFYNIFNDKNYLINRIKRL